MNARRKLSVSVLIALVAFITLLSGSALADTKVTSAAALQDILGGTVNGNTLTLQADTPISLNAPS